MGWLPWRIKNCGMNCLHLIKRSRKCFVYFSSFLISHSLEITISLSNTFFKWNSFPKGRIWFKKSATLLVFKNMILGWTVYSELYRKPRQEVTAVFVCATWGWWRHNRVPIALSLTWKNANRKLQFCIFTLPGFQILARRSLFGAAMLFFVEVKVHLFYRPKNNDHSFIRVQ